jgi:hypothetical protein
MTDHPWQVIKIVPPDESPGIDDATRELFRITSITPFGREVHCGVEMWNKSTKSYRKAAPLVFPDPATLPEVAWEDCPECAAHGVDEDDE